MSQQIRRYNADVIELDDHMRMAGVNLVVVRDGYDDRVRRWIAQGRRILLAMVCGQCAGMHEHVVMTIDEAKTLRQMLDESIIEAETGVGMQ